MRGILAILICSRHQPVSQNSYKAKVVEQFDEERETLSAST